MTINELGEISKALRYWILYMTTKAGSGHVTSSLSAVELMAALYFGGVFKFDLKDPKNPTNDRVIFSKGHVSPLFYALYKVAGILSQKEIDTYRRIGSNLEGHPRPVFEYADLATGSLGMGLSYGIGMAFASKLDGISNMTYVLMGDSEVAEGSVWEAIQLASFYKLGNLIGIIDINRLGQSTETMLGWDVKSYRKRIESFGWEVFEVDGHDLEAIIDFFERVDSQNNKPKMLLAKTVKGKGVSFLEDKEDWHGKALDEEQFKEAVFALGKVNGEIKGDISKPVSSGKIQGSDLKFEGKIYTDYKIGEKVSTRKAYGESLAKLGRDKRIISLDGEVKNSTFAELFAEKYPDRFFQMYIAEQNMVSVAAALSKRGKIPFVSTFSVFLTRAHDQIRMANYSEANIKFVGSHTGVSIGEDGPSQMGLEEISLFRTLPGTVILVPADAVSCFYLTKAALENNGVVYIATFRPDTKVIYEDNEVFKVGGSKVLREGKNDKATIIACGICVGEALGAYDLLSKEKIDIKVIDAYSVKPIDEKTIKKAARETGRVIVVEDQYMEGGLGDSVLNCLVGESVSFHKLAISKIPTSGKTGELLGKYKIDAQAIAGKVKEII